VAYSKYNPGICLRRLRESIVENRHIAKQWLCKQRPFLGKARNIHASNNKRTVFSVIRAANVSVKWLGKHVSAATDTKATIKERRFLCGPCRELITRTTGAMSSVDSLVASSISQRGTA
jgi:hypothetical protein